MATSRQSITWHAQILPRATQKALAFFSEQAWLKRSNWYLAGGTALALQTGNRISYDLDFFSTQKHFKTRDVLSRLEQLDWETTDIEADTIYGTMLKAKVSFIAYPFFVPVEKPHWYGAIRVLDIKDVAVMKIIAISQRGRKRDFQSPASLR